MKSKVSKDLPIALMHMIAPSRNNVSNRLFSNQLIIIFSYKQSRLFPMSYFSQRTLYNFIRGGGVSFKRNCGAASGGEYSR